MRSAPPPTPPATTGGPTAGLLARNGGPQARTAQLLLVAMFVIVAVALAFSTLDRGRESVEMSRTGQPFSGAAPAEWNAKPLWQSPPLLASSGRALVVVGGGSVAMITADRKVVLVDAASGRTTWAVNLPDGDLKTPLADTTVGGTAGVAAQVGDTLVFWDANDGGSREFDLPTGSRTTFRGDAPLAVASGTATTIVQGKAVTTAVPSGAIPLAARADGTITAASSAGWWHLAPGGGAAAPTAWESPTGATIRPTVLGYSGHSVITALPGSPAQAVVYSDRPKDVRLAFRGPIVLPSGKGAQVTWSPAPNGTWGLLGRSLVDLRRGRVQDLGAWTTRLVSADRAFGRVGNQDVVAGPTIPRGLMKPGEGFPEDLTTAGAIVRSRTSAGETVSVLPPRVK